MKVSTKVREVQVQVHEATIYLVEVKDENKLKAPDVISNKERGIKYYEIATD